MKVWSDVRAICSKKLGQRYVELRRAVMQRQQQQAFLPVDVDVDNGVSDLIPMVIVVAVVAMIVYWLI